MLEGAAFSLKVLKAFISEKRETASGLLEPQ